MKTIPFILLIALPCFGQTTNCVPPPTGIVGWWPGEGTGYDTIGGNDGVIHGGVTFATGLVGQAFQFDGLHSDLRVPASPSLNVGAGPGMSIELWINPADRTGRPLFDWSPNGAYGAHFWVNETGVGDLYGNLVDTSGAFHIIQSGSLALITNGFQHVALTYDKSSGTARLYLNGAIVAQSNLGTFTPQTSTDLQIGYRLPGAPFGEHSFYGLIDEASLYNRALTTNEIQAIFAAGSSGKCPGPPVIHVQPQSQIAIWGGSATFTVVATGALPLEYIWYQVSSPIQWGTNSSLVLTNVSLNAGGVYYVVVTNVLGSATSSNALLVVNPAGVSAGLYPGLTIQGTVGKTFGIQYATNLGPNSTWMTITQLTLMQPVQLWFDASDNVADGTNPRRFYKVMAIP